MEDGERELRAQLLPAGRFLGGLPARVLLALLQVGALPVAAGAARGVPRVPAGAEGGLEADIRGRLVPVRVVKYPFVRDGKACAGI